MTDISTGGHFGGATGPDQTAPTHHVEGHRGRRARRAGRAQDTQSSAQGEGATTPVLYLAGVPLLSAPGQTLSSSQLLEQVGLALSKHRKSQSDAAREHRSITALAADKKTQTSTNFSRVADPTPDNPNNTKLVSTTTSIDTTSLKSEVIGMSADSLGAEIFREIRKHYRGKPKSFTLNQIQAFVREALTSGVLLTIMPAFSLTQTNATNFASGDKASAAASAVSFTDLLNKAGSQIEALAKSFFAGDAKLAAIVAASTKDAFLSLAVYQLSTALNVPDLSDHLLSQAALTRSQIDEIGKDNFQATETKKLVDIVVNKNPEITRKEAHQKIAKALRDVADNGSINTRQELLSALETSFKKAFPGQTEQSRQLAAIVAADALDNALLAVDASSLTFDIAKLDVQSIEDSIKSAILNAWTKSIEITNQQIKAANIAAQIRKNIENQQYKNERELKEDIQTQLEAQGFDTEVAKRIARGLDFTVRPRPLDDPTRLNVLPPVAFKAAIHKAVNNHLNVPPDSPLAKSIDNLLGLSSSVEPTDMIGLINKAYREGQKEGVNFLMKSKREVLHLAGLLFAPGNMLITSWSAVMNGTPDHENAKVTANNIV